MADLEAAHAAPSVGFMQPWNFILIESVEIRGRIKESFDAVNSQEKLKLEGTSRSGLYNSLKLEGILEAPLNIAVTCDHTRNGAYVLGRGPMPQTAPYSVCLAIENLWLAARSEGIGVGWVSILDQGAVEGILGLPQGVELIAYLCIGYPVEFRPDPAASGSGLEGARASADAAFQGSMGNAGCTGTKWHTRSGAFGDAEGRKLACRRRFTAGDAGCSQGVWLAGAYFRGFQRQY